MTELATKPLVGKTFSIPNFAKDKDTLKQIETGTHCCWSDRRWPVNPCRPGLHQSSPPTPGGGGQRPISCGRHGRPVSSSVYGAASRWAATDAAAGTGGASAACSAPAARAAAAMPGQAVTRQLAAAGRSIAHCKLLPQSYQCASQRAAAAEAAYTGRTKKCSFLPATSGRGDRKSDGTYFGSGIPRWQTTSHRKTPTSACKFCRFSDKLIVLVSASSSVTAVAWSG